MQNTSTNEGLQVRELVSRTWEVVKSSTDDDKFEDWRSAVRGADTRTLVDVTARLSSRPGKSSRDLKALREGRTAFDAESDRRGPITIAAVATLNTANTGTNPSQAGTSASGSAESTDQPEKDKSTRAARLVVFGDSDFANNSLFSVQGNGNLFLNTVSWLAEEEDLIAIRPRKGGGSGPVMLTAAQAPLIFWLPVVMLPLAVLASGAAVFMRRKWQQ